jgi:type-F conjugative transfer system pilin assembly protein TrbC
MASMAEKNMLHFLLRALLMGLPIALVYAAECEADEKSNAHQAIEQAYQAVPSKTQTPVDIAVPQDILKKLDRAAQEPLSEESRQEIGANMKQAEESMNSPDQREMVNRSLDGASRTMTGIDLQVQPGPGIDVMKLIERANQSTRPSEKYPSPVFVFVSSSLPDITMKILVSQSQRAGVPLVFRGLIKNDIKETARYIQSFVGADSKAGIIIDPTLFDRFKIDKVPAFTVVEGLRECGVQTTSCSTENYATVYGDVSLDYALEALQRTAPQFKTLLSDPLNRMRGN